MNLTSLFIWPLDFTTCTRNQKRLQHVSIPQTNNDKNWNSVSCGLNQPWNDYTQLALMHLSDQFPSDSMHYFVISETQKNHRTTTLGNCLLHLIMDVSLKTQISKFAGIGWAWWLLQLDNFSNICRSTLKQNLTFCPLSLFPSIHGHNITLT
jgi:hypothetical protein